MCDEISCHIQSARDTKHFLSLDQILLVPARGFSCPVLRYFDHKILIHHRDDDELIFDITIVPTHVERSIRI